MRIHRGIKYYAVGEIVRKKEARSLGDLASSFQAGDAAALLVQPSVLAMRGTRSQLGRYIRRLPGRAG